MSIAEFTGNLKTAQQHRHEARSETFESLARQVADLRNSPAVLAESAVWKDVAHAIFNLKEFLYIR